MINQGTKLLNGRYDLTENPVNTDANSQTWIADGPYSKQYLIKIWSYVVNGSGEAPDDFQRALWDFELRNLYRLSSSPGANDSLLVLRDAGVDRDMGCFVMALEGEGYKRLADVFSRRSQFPWLSNQDVKARSELWAGLLRMAEGLQLLHNQQMLHRNVGVQTVFFHEYLGVESLRLGGFEWSMRLHLPAQADPPTSWASPPEFFSQQAIGYSMETDWYAFGMLSVRCLLDLEDFDPQQPKERHQSVVRTLSGADNITPLERIFLLQLIATNPQDRLSQGYKIQTQIRDIITGLRKTEGEGGNGRSLVVIINPSFDRLYGQAQNLGFVPNPDDPQRPFNPHDPLHTLTLKKFIQDDLEEAQLYAVHEQKYYLLVGKQLILQLVPFRATDRRQDTWDLAFCQGIANLRGNEGGSQVRQLPRGQVVVRTVEEANRERSIRRNARSWEQFLPKIDRAAQLRTELARFHEFIRCANQLDLLILDSQIFPYKVAERRDDQPGVECIVIQETTRKRRTLKFLKNKEAGMIEALQREIESRKPRCEEVVLTPPGLDGLSLPKIPDYEFWKIREINPDLQQVILERTRFGKKLAPAPDEGYLRTYGMFGSVDLLRRRSKAIKKLMQHSYLLRSLAAPGQVYMDTGVANLPVPMDPQKVDEAKRAAIQDILRVRPIYTLQGPPGTGKTTLVAHLLREILTDDPVAQILITAQAHGAVDVLREKVSDAFEGVPEKEQPLAVRLGTMDTEDEGSVLKVSLKELERVKTSLTGLPHRPPLQEEWLQCADEMIAALKTMTSKRDAPDFCELVKRGANLTYCTTSAGELENLADLVQSFDWSIVEEAGKVHSFDLALPLQAGHRWLLIGDQKQLPAYRIEDYKDAIKSLENAIEILEEFPNRWLVDWQWIRTYRDYDDDGKSSFKKYAERWIEVFEALYKECRSAPGSDKETERHPIGALAGILSGQHRMHPDIGELISRTYYDGKIINCTVTKAGEILPRVIHPFDQPSDIKGKAIVWINLPWAVKSGEFAEIGGTGSGKPRYSNEKEVEALLWFFNELNGNHFNSGDPLSAAILSPYNVQVHHINRTFALQKFARPGLNFRPRLHSRKVAGQQAPEFRYAHTVDSFQGNQADIIAVSLTRNNTRPPREGMGFLQEPKRMNVLLSRAEKLLVLVGSLEFFEHQISLVNDHFDVLWHWQQATGIIRDWISGGKVLIIDYPAKGEGL